MWTLNASTSELILKKKHQKLLTLHSTFCLFFFFFQSKKLNCHPECIGVYFSWRNHQKHFKMVHSNTKTANSRVRQSQMCYLHTTHSPALNRKFCYDAMILAKRIVYHIVDMWDLLMGRAILYTRVMPSCTLACPRSMLQGA